jgi:hypothetical protein
MNYSEEVPSEPLNVNNTDITAGQTINHMNKYASKYYLPSPSGSQKKSNRWQE